MLEKVDFRRFLASFIKYLSDLYQIYLFVKTTGKASLKELLGYQLPKDIEKNRINLAISLKEKEYLSLFEFLLEKELEMKKEKRMKREMERKKKEEERMKRKKMKEERKRKEREERFKKTARKILGGNNI